MAQRTENQSRGKELAFGISRGDWDAPGGSGWERAGVGGPNGPGKEWGGGRCLQRPDPTAPSACNGTWVGPGRRQSSAGGRMTPRGWWRRGRGGQWFGSGLAPARRLVLGLVLRPARRRLQRVGGGARKRRPFARSPAVGGGEHESRKPIVSPAVRPLPIARRAADIAPTPTAAGRTSASPARAGFA